MAYYLLRFWKKGKRSPDAPEKRMIESETALLAKEKADLFADGNGGGKAKLELFTEIGLVATRTPEGVWSR